MKNTQQIQIYEWFQQNKRPLPWRRTADPYKIWISETMLQQTTTQAVAPYFKRFIQTFPKLKDLANAETSDVLEMWSGLGYYSRARNLHKAAQQLHQQKSFPKSYAELLKYPGLGPYTARAVSSIAFKESVGVVDGNVIRFLTRYNDLAIEWWKTKGRNQIQELADQAVQAMDSGEMNQALMELGATLCLPKNPNCILCPVLKSCKGQKNKTFLQLPLAKPKRAKEIWLWQPSLVTRGQKVALVKNDYSPFLRGQLIFPGKVQLRKVKPKQFDFKHMITHHEIYVKLEKKKAVELKGLHDLKWININEVAKVNPASLLTKALNTL